jgi:5S rRNA maturation endonuclease (ribonuclease M5)
VFPCEGEKDCETARALGIVATCNPGGAGKWREEYAEHLRGKQIIIIADKDEPGRKHAEKMAESLYGKAASIKVLQMPGAKDLSEWVERGGTREALEKLIAAVPEWKPQAESASAASTFRLVRLGELLDKPQVATEWVWGERLAVGTVSLVVAKPKVGKSTFARNLALAVSRDETFLGFPHGKARLFTWHSKNAQKTSPRTSAPWARWRTMRFSFMPIAYPPTECLRRLTWCGNTSPPC